MLLLSLLDDPRTARDELTAGQRAALRKHSDLFEAHPQAAVSVSDRRHLALAKRALIVLTEA